MGYCIFCSHCDRESANENKEMDCDLLGYKVTAMRGCPGWKPREDADEPAKITVGVTDGKAQEFLKKESPKTKVAKAVKTIKQTVEREEDLSVQLFEHQKLARAKFKDLDEGALFFEMGCGKTLTSLMIIADKFKAGKINALLVVAPNDVHKQWFDDLCDEESVLSKALAQEGVECVGQIVGGRGGQKELYDFGDCPGKLQIVCVNIDTFSTPHKWEPVVDWANSNNTAIIVDEATVIKNPSSKRAEHMLYEFNDVVRSRKTIKSSVKKDNVKCRFVLTGTPVTNGPMDLWSIMEFVRPGFFGRNYYSFMNYYGMHTKLTVQDRTISVLLTEKTWWGIKHCESYLEAFNTFGCSEDTYMTIKHQDKFVGPYKHAEELKEFLEPAAVFAKLVDCVDMPPCNYMTRKVGMTVEQQVAYDNMKKDMLTVFGDKIADAKNKMVVTLRLQQIASGFIMAHDNLEQQLKDMNAPFWADPEKLDTSIDVAPDEAVWLNDSNPRIEALLRDIDELDRPVLVLTRFSAEAAKLFDLLKDKYSTCLITGWKTVGSIEGFKKGEFDIMVANTAKIARGHNLQRAHTTLYYSNTFSMELRQQSEFRTFRIGQEHPCTYIDYESCQADRDVTNALRLKKNLLEYIREKNKEETV